MVRLWVTCVTCVAFSVVRLAVAAVVRDGLVLEYAMPRNECVEAAFTDSGSNADVFGALRRDNVTTRCLDGIGVGGNTDDDGICVMSESDATALKAEFAAAQVAGADGLTIELWFTPRNPGQSSDRQPIFSIGNVNPDSTEDCDGTTAIRVVERNSELTLYVAYREKMNELGCFDETCCRYRTTTGGVLSKNVPTHAVFVLGEYLDVYINGEALVDGMNAIRFFEWSNFDFERAWDDSFKLELFSDGVARREEAAAFDGNIMAVRLYSRRLNESEAKQNYAAKLPNSAPLALDVAVTVSEDGEEIAGGQLGVAPQRYLAVLQPGLLGTVVLGVVDADDELSASNYYEYHANTTSDTYAAAYLSALPSVGEVLLPDGTVLTAADLPARVPRDATGNYSVLVRPPLDAFSGDGSLVGGNDASLAMLSLSYYAVDGVDGTISAVATMKVAVAAVNDPPVPFFNISAHAYAGTPVIITLGGTDVDDSLVGIVASVATAPRSGNATLWQVDAASGSVSTIKIAPGDALWSLAVAYTFEGPMGPATMNADTGVFLNETFGIALTDVHGATSFAVNVTVAVHTPLFATPSTKTPEVHEEAHGGADANEISLRGSDLSDAALDLCIVITALPSHGALYDPASATPAAPLAAGAVLATRLASPYTLGAPMIFAGDTDWFSVPNLDWDEEVLGLSSDAVEYAAFSCDAPNRVSSSAWQPVDVRNVNDAPTLAASETSFTVYATGSTQSSSSSDRDKYADTVALVGLTLGDLDLDLDAVRISITSRHGLLSLREDDLKLADFNSAEYCYDEAKDWFCCCDGQREKSITFVATPTDAATLLAGLTYESYEANTVDTVTISVYDGVDGECLATHKTESICDETCFSSNVSLTVDVGEYAAFAAESDSNDDGLPWQLVLGAAVGGLVLACTCCICGHRKYSRRQRKTGSSSSSPKHSTKAARNEARTPSSPALERPSAKTQNAKTRSSIIVNNQRAPSWRSPRPMRETHMRPPPLASCLETQDFHDLEIELDIWRQNSFLSHVVARSLET